MKRAATLGILLALTACQQQQQEPDVTAPPSPVINHALPMLVDGETTMTQSLALMEWLEETPLCL